MITTANSQDFFLPSRCGIVSQKEFKDYFGPFAGRVYYSRVQPNINLANLNELRLVPGIGEIRAQLIINERNANGRFTNIDDTFKRLKRKVPMDFLNAYTY